MLIVVVGSSCDHRIYTRPKVVCEAGKNGSRPDCWLVGEVGVEYEIRKE